jgi:hypothetical protein
VKIYKDKALKDEVHGIVDFDIVGAGDSKEMTLYAHNDSTAILRALEFFTEHNEISIIASPDYMAPNEVAELRIKWSPSVSLKDGLKTPLFYRAEELYRKK